MEKFFAFIVERQRIWHKKEILKLPSPWTIDPVLAKFKFCCVYRELDACTKHLIERIINTALPFREKVFNILLYRRFNTRDFFDRYGVQKCDGFDFDGLVDKMDEAKKQGVNLFNDAYIICQRTFESKYRKRDKHYQQLLIMHKLSENFNLFLVGKSIEEFHKKFMAMPLTGAFLSYQYCTDLTYIKELENVFPDLNEYTYVGPGAKGGVDLLFPGHIKDYEYYCRIAWQAQKEYMPKEWEDIYYRDAYYKSKWLSLSNIQSCLCEFRKWSNLSNPSIKCRKRYYKGADNGLL